MKCFKLLILAFVVFVFCSENSFAQQTTTPLALTVGSTTFEPIWSVVNEASEPKTKKDRKKWNKKIKALASGKNKTEHPVSILLTFAQLSLSKNGSTYNDYFEQYYEIFNGQVGLFEQYTPKKTRLTDVNSVKLNIVKLIENTKKQNELNKIEAKRQEQERLEAERQQQAKNNEPKVVIGCDTPVYGEVTAGNLHDYEKAGASQAKDEVSMFKLVWYLNDEASSENTPMVTKTISKVEVKAGVDTKNEKARYACSGAACVSGKDSLAIALYEALVLGPSAVVTGSSDTDNTSGWSTEEIKTKIINAVESVLTLKAVEACRKEKGYVKEKDVKKEVANNKQDIKDKTPAIPLGCDTVAYDDVNVSDLIAYENADAVLQATNAESMFKLLWYIDDEVNYETINNTPSSKTYLDKKVKVTFTASDNKYTATCGDNPKAKSSNANITTALYEALVLGPNELVYGSNSWGPKKEEIIKAVKAETTSKAVEICRGSSKVHTVEEEAVNTVTIEENSAKKEKVSNKETGSTGSTRVGYGDIEGSTWCVHAPIEGYKVLEPIRVTVNQNQVNVQCIDDAPEHHFVDAKEIELNNIHYLIIAKVVGDKVFASINAMNAPTTFGACPASTKQKSEKKNTTGSLPGRVEPVTKSNPSTINNGNLAGRTWKTPVPGNESLPYIIVHVYSDKIVMTYLGTEIVNEGEIKLPGDDDLHKLKATVDNGKLIVTLELPVEQDVPNTSGNTDGTLVGTYWETPVPGRETQESIYINIESQDKIVMNYRDEALVNEGTIKLIGNFISHQLKAAIKDDKLAVTLTLPVEEYDSNSTGNTGTPVQQDVSNDVERVEQEELDVNLSGASSLSKWETARYVNDDGISPNLDDNNYLISIDVNGQKEIKEMRYSFSDTPTTTQTVTIKQGECIVLPNKTEVVVTSSFEDGLLILNVGGKQLKLNKIY